MGDEDKGDRPNEEKDPPEDLYKDTPKEPAEKYFLPTTRLAHSPKNNAPKLAPVFLNKRRGSPLSKCVSCGDLREDLESSKRPRGEGTRSDYTDQLEQEILHLLKEISPTTKLEIKQSSQKIKVLFDLMRNCPEEKWSQQEPEVGQATETREICTQTPSSIPDESVAADIRELFKFPDQLQVLMETDWPKATYECTRIGKGGIFKAHPNVDRVVVLRNGAIDKSEMFKRLCQIHPVISKLTNENLKGGQIAVVSSADAVEIEGETSNDKAQSLIFACLDNEEHGSAIALMKKVVIKLQELHSSKACVAFPKDMNFSTCRKWCEVGFTNTGIKVEVVASKLQREAHHIKEVKGLKAKGDRPTNMSSTLTIRSKDSNKSFAEIVKTMQDKIDPNSEGVNISTIKETKTGVLVRFREKSHGAARTFVDKVKQVTGPDISCTQGTGAIIVQDVEVGATADDVKEALAEALGLNVINFTAGEVRLNARGSGCVTIGLPSEHVERAVRLKSIGLKWTRAKIKEKIQPDFCVNCQRYGHRHCSEPRALRRCTNCGETDHLRAACDKKECFCFFCDTEGHRENSMACPKYRALVEVKRKNV